MKLPLVRYGGDDSPIARWEWWFAPVVCPLFMAGLALASVLTILAAPITLPAIRMRDRRFARRMTERGRFAEWPEVEARLRAGVGTLLIEERLDVGSRFWWTSDDAAAVRGRVHPGDDGYIAGTRAAGYLHPEYGRALLTRVPGHSLAAILTAECLGDRVVSIWPFGDVEEAAEPSASPDSAGK